jgi:isoleucyl-tRNA synthetase
MPPEPSFPPVPAEPDHPELERAVLERWDGEGTFFELKRKNAGGPTFSFFDGPITANNGMGVHHAWGRALKDLYQRYHAALGEDGRYQNGFDCQGLWVEVEVEKALGLNSKPEIETYGLDRFSRACRDRVAKYAGVITEQTRRLGNWMDWERSYFTMTDPNVSAIWGFLRVCADRDWLYRGHRSNPWCPRCGTSLSQHELIDSYQDVLHPSLYVHFRLLDAPSESLLVWTTTPWTLPANVAAAVHPDAAYVKVENGVGYTYLAESRVESIFGAHAAIVERLTGAELVDRRYHTGFDELAAQEGVEHRVIPWRDVALDEGTGVVHIAPGCGAEDYQLSLEHGLPALTPVDESGAFVDGYGWLHGWHTGEAAERIIWDLGERGWLLREETIQHRYPHCWRCGTELIFRLVDEWFISCDEIRQPMIEAARGVEWTPPQYGKRMEDWLRNMGDWCISRKRYWGLPLPFWFCPDGHMTVISSEEDMRERATTGLDGLQELHRPWIDDVKIACATCGQTAERVPDVGDCWLDAGIVPFSTLGYGNETAVPEGFAKGAGEGLTKADLPSHQDWEHWFPADWVSEMREQIRLWFYSMLFMSVTLVGRSPYRRVLCYEKLNDETGRPMHKSWGNAIWFDDAVEHVGADVMRWMFAAQNPGQNMNFGYGPAREIQRKLLTLWNSYRFLVLYASPEGWRPDPAVLDRGPEPEEQLDRWIVARVQELTAVCRDALDRYWAPDLVRACEAFFDDLSNWYVRRTRPRFWQGDAKAFATLHYALVQTARLVGPVMPFLADELWATLMVAPLGEEAPSSVHLARYPEVDEALLDRELLAAMADARAVVELGHGARDHSRIRLRQPLAAAVVSAADPARLTRLDQLAGEIASELNVKRVDVETDPERLVEREVVPNFRVLGPRLGAAVQAVKKALAEGDHRPDAEGRVAVDGHVLEPGEYELRTRPRPGFEAMDDGLFVVAVDTTLTDDLRLEGIARDLVRHLQNARKEAGLDISDRITLRYQANERARAAIESHGEWIAGEVLAVELEAGPAGDHPFEADGAEATFALARRPS